jgi:general nucleoside transport system ATP-binding protein
MRRAIEVETAGMTKRFGGFTALDAVSIRVKAGSFHALLGENGAGKSTLVKCVMGFYTPTTGQVMVGGKEVTIRNPRDAHHMGLGMVYQHFTLVPSLTAAENLVIARPDVPKVIDWTAEHRRLEEFMDVMPFRVPLDRPTSALAAGEKQKLEILKQLYLDRRFLILDEPTSVLTPGEADEVLGLLRKMTQKGDLTVLMITHKFREVMAFADHVSVLRRGAFAGGGAVATLTTDDLATMMIGAERPQMGAVRADRAPGDARLEVTGLSAADGTGRLAVDGVDLVVRAGEIVGIAGVSGNGQSELVEVLAGQRFPTAGAVKVAGAPYGARRAEMARLKVYSLPEEPLKNACVAPMTVGENLAFRTFDRQPFASGGWWVNGGAIRRRARELIASYKIKTRSTESPIGTLSGGNVQRTVLARELSGDVDVLVVANPCFGLDFAAVADIRGQIVAARNRGTAVLLVSEDLDEILELADRILVMSEGRIVHETTAAAAEMRVIGQYMAGHHEAA